MGRSAATRNQLATAQPKKINDQLLDVLIGERYEDGNVRNLAAIIEKRASVYSRKPVFIGRDDWI